MIYKQNSLKFIFYYHKKIKYSLITGQFDNLMLFYLINLYLNQAFIYFKFIITVIFKEFSYEENHNK